MGDEKPKVVALHSGEAREGHPNENDPAPGPLKENGQHEDYWVLSEEEIAKGFVRPVRNSYVHKGIRPKFPTRELTSEEKERYEGVGYVLFEPYPEDHESGSTGRFWTQKDLDSGCGVRTVMSQRLAETYARQPSFYGSTFCCGCSDHFPVRQFVWDGTDEVVGS